MMLVLFETLKTLGASSGARDARRMLAQLPERRKNEKVLGTLSPELQSIYAGLEKLSDEVLARERALEQVSRRDDSYEKVRLELVGDHLRVQELKGVFRVAVREEAFGLVKCPTTWTSDVSVRKGGVIVSLLDVSRSTPRRW